MAAALPGLALQAFADLWGQQPELAAGLYAVGAVAAAVPRYVPTFEQAKFWCQKPRQPTRPVAESIPVASEAFGTVSTTFSPNHSPPVVIITRSAATSLTSETILMVRDRVEPGASDFTAPFKPAYTDSGSPAVRSVISTESSSFQARPASSATVETLSDVVNKVLDAALAETPNLSSEHIAPKPSIKTSVSSMAASDETAAGSSRRPVRWAGTQTSAPLNISLEPEGESASNSVDAESSASDEEASNCTNMVSAVSPNMSSHGIPTHGNSTPDDPRFSNEATQQTTGIASSSVTSMDSGEFGQKPSRTLFQVVANNLPAMPKSYKQTESSSNDNKDRKPSSKTASSRLPSEQFLSETLDDFSRLGEHRPVFTTSVERQPSEPLHASPLLAESESLSSFKSRYASEQSYVAYRAEREPTASSNYNDFISWLDIVLILVPSILIATSIGFAGNDPLDQDLYATLVATLCTVVVGCLPCLDFRWLTLRYSFLAMYRHSLESISSFMVYLTGFVRQWQETLSGVLRKQHANHIDTDRVPNAVLIGLVFIVLLITINQMISRLSQHAELTRWEANRLRLYKGFVGTIAALIVVWFSGYVQDFILVLTTAGFIYLLHSYYGQILGFASRSVFETCRLVKEAMWPYVAVYAAVTATVYLASHLQQVFECFKGTNGGVSLPINHCAIVVKYGALSIAVLLMHIPIVSRGLRIIRARIQERYNRIAHDRHIAPWHPALGGDRFWLSLTIIVLGAEKVSEVMTEWTVPTLKTGAMLIVTLTLARVLMPLCPMLLSRIWDTVQSCTAELSMTTAHASKEAMLMTSKRALTFQRWSVGLLTRMISDSVSNTWAMVSLALGKISTNSRFFYNTNIEPVVVYIDLSCYSDWCQGRAWGWVPRAITIVLATVLCTAGWVIAARAYPEHKVRSSLSFAVSFMVVYILGTFGALGCTQDYIIVLITMFAILIHLPLEIEAPTDGTPASVALVDETPIDEVLAADELFPDVMQADEDPAVEAPPNPPARPAMSVPGSVALPLPSGWWWQPMIDWLHINNAARAAKERAIEEARVVAEQEIANFRSQVQFTRDLTSGTNTTQLPSNEDETQTTRKAWNTTQPFRPMYMYTEREYQAALRGEMPATAISEATLRPLAESVPTPLAQDSAVSVATDLSILASALPSATTSVLAPLFTPATPAASAPQTTTILSTTSSPVRADSSYPATSSSSLFASAPMATPDVTQERIVSINEMPTEVDNPDALPILMASSSGSRPQGDCNHETSTPIATTTTPAVLDRTPFHELAFAPVTGLAEPGMPAMDPGSEQGPSSLPNPTVSASIVQSAEPSPGPSKSLDEDKLAAELGHTGTEDRIGYVENAQADDQQQDRQHNEGDSDDEEEFSSSGGVTGLGDRTFEEEPIDKTEGLDDEDLAAAKQLHEEMESGAKRNEAITSVQAASDEAPPLTDNCDDNEQTGTKTEQPVGRTLMDVDSVIIPSTAGDGFQDEHGNVIDTPMSDVPENGADMLELKVLSANSGDDITMGGTDNEEASDRGGGNDDEPEEEDGGTGGNRPTSDKSSGDGEKLDANKPSPVAHPSISMGDVVGCSFSEEGIHGEIVPDTQFSNDVHTSDNKLESNDPKDEDGGDDSSDCSEPHGRLQASTVGGTTSAAPFSNAGEAIAAAADTTMMKNDEDSEMIDVAIIGEAEMGNAGCNASASAQFNTTGLLKAIQASQSADGQPNEGFTTPSGMEGGQDHITDDDDDWDSIYASANGHVSSPNMQRSSNAQDPPIDPSGTYSPFSNVSSGDSDGNVSSSHQIDDFETEQLAQIEATKKDKQMQIDAQRDLGLPLNGYVQLPGIRNQSHDDIRRADDKHGDLTAGIMRIDYNNHDTDYQQTHGIDRDFETSPDSSPGDVQLPTAVDDETNPDTDGLNWTDIRPKTRLVQLWEDRQIVDNPDYPPHRSAGMRPLETTYGQPCQIFREVDVAAYEFFGENHENFQYAQEGVDWFHPEAEGAEPREEFEGEVGEENNVAANEVGRVDDDLSARVAASKTESNAAFRLDYSDSESTLSDPPDSTGLDTIGANLLTEEMDCKILVPKNGGRELIDNSALVSEEAYPSKKGNSVSASLPDDDDTESHLVITDAMREKAARFGCTTDSQILDFMESIDRPEKREGGKFLIPKSWKDRKGNVAGSSTSSAVMLSPLQAPAQQSVPKKRYNGPVSFKFDEGDVQPRLKPAPPMTKNLLEKMADFNSDPVKRAALQDMANKVGDTSKIQSPAWTSAIATNNSPFASKFQDASNSPRLQKSNSTSPSSHPRSSISSSGYDSIRASSLPFDPSKPRPYVPEGFDPGVLDKLNSTNPFGRSSSTNASTPSYLQRDAIISPTRRLVYRLMRLPEATLSTLDDPLVRSSAHNPSNTSTEMAAPPVNPPIYDSLQPAAGMASEISSVGSLSYDYMEPSVGYTVQPAVSDATELSNDSPRSAHQPSALPATTTIDPNRMVDIDSDP